MSGQQQINETGEVENEFVNASEGEVNILDTPVNEKSYSRPNVSAGERLNTPIPEPTFTPPPVDFSKPPTTEKPKQEPINPEMAELGKKDKEMASEVLAGMILDGYGMLHMLANKGLMVSEKKLVKMQQEGEINLGVEIQYEYGKYIRAGEFFEQYNKQAETTLSVSEEFKEEVTPVLKKVLEKRGLGLTPEQQLGYMFAKDVAGKAFIFMSMKSQLNQMIDVIKDATSANPMSKANAPQSTNTNREEPPAPQPNPEPTPAPQPSSPSEVSDITDEGSLGSNLYQQPTNVTTAPVGTGIAPTTIVIQNIPPKKRAGRKAGQQK